MKVKFEAFANMLRVTEYDNLMVLLKIESFSIHSFKIESVGTKLNVNGSTNTGIMRYFEEWNNYLDAADLPYASQAAAETAIASLIMPLVNYANGTGSSSTGGGGDATAANQALQIGLATTTNTLLVKNLPFNADSLQQSNPDANGNYQTIQYFSGGLAGTLVKTVNLTFDTQKNPITYVEV